jgi:uncharacterized membrane protein YgdD (TMEM256/DUF423 family)
MNFRTALLTGAAICGLGVVIGAFGAHALNATLERNGRIDTFELAVRYLFYHGFAIIICGLLLRHQAIKIISFAAATFLIGIVFFSGSLFILCLTNVRSFGAITPIGGLLFIVGWVCVFAGCLKFQK